MHTPSLDDFLRSRSTSDHLNEADVTTLESTINTLVQRDRTRLPRGKQKEIVYLLARTNQELFERTKEQQYADEALRFFNSTIAKRSLGEKESIEQDRISVCYIAHSLFRKTGRPEYLKKSVKERQKIIRTKKRRTNPPDTFQEHKAQAVCYSRLFMTCSPEEKGHFAWKSMKENYKAYLNAWKSGNSKDALQCLEFSRRVLLDYMIISGDNKWNDFYHRLVSRSFRKHSVTPDEIIFPISKGGFCPGAFYLLKT